MNHRNRVSELGVNLHRVQIANDQQRRILQRRRVLAKLTKRLNQTLTFTLVLPTKMAAFPHISPTIAATRLFRPLLEAIPFSMRILLGRRLDAQ